MAIKTRFSPPTSVDRAYREDPLDSDLTRKAVLDEITHDKLDEVKDAISGTTDTTPQIYNVVVATANNEVSQTLPANTKGFIIHARNATLQFSYQSGQSGTVFVTVPNGASFKDENFYSSQTLYFQTSIATTVELIAYT